MTPEQLKELPDSVLIERLIMSAENSKRATMALCLACTEVAVNQLIADRKENDSELENCKKELLRCFEFLRK